ncbi:MAG: hypothetical protein ACI8PZ_005361, partial [Myxococcota bacterium]
GRPGQAPETTKSVARAATGMRISMPGSYADETAASSRWRSRAAAG